MMGRATHPAAFPMTAPKPLVLVAYFFVLSILGIYGWHRYYLVYEYMKNKDRVPGPPPPVSRVAGRHDPAADLQRDVRRRSARRRGVRDRLPAREARDSGARRFDRRDVRHRAAGRGAARRPRVRHRVPASHGSHGLQGRRARRGPARSPRASSSRSSTRTSCRPRTSCGARCRTSPSTTGWRSCRRAGAISTTTIRC